MSKKPFLFLAVLLPMCLATAIYLLFRSEELVIFQILEQLNLLDPVFAVRRAVSNFHPYHWFALSFPGSLWMFSSMNLLLWIWKFNIRKQNALWIFSPFLFAIALEIMQLQHFTDGTFDGQDLIMYTFMALLFVIIYFFRQRNFPDMQLSKSMHWKSLGYMMMLFSVVYCSDKATADPAHKDPLSTGTAADRTPDSDNLFPDYHHASIH
ncbi:MAG: hypothetical protein ACKOXB_06770 [Flavobacteriales bacterium]